MSSSSISLSISATNALRVALPIPSFALSFSNTVALPVKASKSSSDLTVATDSCCLVSEITFFINKASCRVCSRVAKARLKEQKRQGFPIQSTLPRVCIDVKPNWVFSHDVTAATWEEWNKKNSGHIGGVKYFFWELNSIFMKILPFVFVCKYSCWSQHLRILQTRSPLGYLELLG